MAGYLVLARKYRSETFEEVVGQEPIARTLTNAIRTGRVAHAYLFTGTRGVGKTTMARILAKALNCLDGDEPTPTPCGTCDACVSIARGDDVDVIEIDGASNRGIDEIRELRNNAIFRPSRCRFKVYYIDEVHMLTKEAFNALLKTLEEPPSHVKFIFATTEVEKVPATILSRCQRFDFRNIPTAKIAEHLKAICEKETVAADADALYRVARAAAGSMRDGLSLLDQLLAGAEKVTDEEVIRVLGTPPDERTIAIVQAIADANAAAALGELAAVLDSGVTLTSVTAALSDMFRNMMLAATCGPESELIELPETQRKNVGELTGRFSTPAIVQAVGVLQRTSQNIRGSSVGRALVEAALVRLAEADKFVDPASLIERLEQMAAGGTAMGQKKKPVTNIPAGMPRPAAAPVRATPPTAAQPEPTPSPEPEPKKKVKPLSSDEKQKVQDDPAVREAMTLFGGNMVHMERVETPDPAVVTPGAETDEEETEQE
ncbi:MAG: DNA polymerase III subunit gamma/tau [Phycisphaerae bacterium]|nr:DNA polymerase III subunit gamma/tau [Phycisphaerae bacterium]